MCGATYTLLIIIDGAAHAGESSAKNVCIDHGRLDIAVAEKLLDGSNVVSAFEPMCRKKVSEGVARDSLGQPRCHDCLRN